MFTRNEKENVEYEGDLEKIQLKHLVIAFLILGVGCFVALIVCLLEMIIGREKKVQEGQQGRENENQNMESYSLD